MVFNNQLYRGDLFVDVERELWCLTISYTVVICSVDVERELWCLAISYIVVICL